jgi:hypothetical protein
MLDSYAILSLRNEVGLYSSLGYRQKLFPALSIGSPNLLNTIVVTSFVPLRALSRVPQKHRRCSICYVTPYQDAIQRQHEAPRLVMHSPLTHDISVSYLVDIAAPQE